MADDALAFGAAPEQVDKLLAWPLTDEVDDIVTTPLTQLTEGPGGQIDRYKLLQVLGEGAEFF